MKTQNIQQFMWFDLKPISTSKEEEVPLLFKEITILELSNLKALITTKRTLSFSHNTSYIFLIT